MVRSRRSRSFRDRVAERRGQPTGDKQPSDRERFWWKVYNAIALTCQVAAVGAALIDVLYISQNQLEGASVARVIIYVLIFALGRGMQEAAKFLNK